MSIIKIISCNAMHAKCQAKQKVLIFFLFILVFFHLHSFNVKTFECCEIICKNCFEILKSLLRIFRAMVFRKYRFFGRTISRDFLRQVFVTKQRLLVLLKELWDDFESGQIFEELFKFEIYSPVMASLGSWSAFSKHYSKLGLEVWKKLQNDSSFYAALGSLSGF